VRLLRFPLSILAITCLHEFCCSFYTSLLDAVLARCSKQSSYFTLGAVNEGAIEFALYGGWDGGIARDTNALFEKRNSSEPFGMQNESATSQSAIVGHPISTGVCRCYYLVGCARGCTVVTVTRDTCVVAERRTNLCIFLQDTCWLHNGAETSIIGLTLVCFHAQGSHAAATTAMLLSVSFYVIVTTLPATMVYVLEDQFTHGSYNMTDEEIQHDERWQRYFKYITVRKVIEEVCYRIFVLLLQLACLPATRSSFRMHENRQTLCRRVDWSV
jgi:hypothetical protein